MAATTELLANASAQSNTTTQKLTPGRSSLTCALEEAEQVHTNYTQLEPFILEYDLGVGVLDGILYAVGGHDGPMVRKSVEAYDPERCNWTTVSDMALCRRNAGVVGMNGVLYVVGGDDGTSNLASVEVIYKFRHIKK